MMKKIAFFSFIVVYAGLASAAQANWSAYNFTTDTNISGTAYLIQYTGAEPITSSEIANKLISDGISPGGDSFSLLGQTTELVDEYGVGFSGKTLTGLDISSNNGFFTLVIDENENFYLSDILNDVTSVETTPGSGEFQYFLEFYNYLEEDDYTWYTGKLGSGPVPEPTALALLAFGVAGVALRRRFH